MKKKYTMKNATNFKDWRKELDEWEKAYLNLPFPPKMLVVPHKQSPYEKKMAILMEKFINYESDKVYKSKILKTPWGVLIWKPN